LGAILRDKDKDKDKDKLTVKKSDFSKTPQRYHNGSKHKTLHPKIPSLIQKILSWIQRCNLGYKDTTLDPKIHMPTHPLPSFFLIHLPCTEVHPKHLSLLLKRQLRHALVLLEGATHLATNPTDKILLFDG
jgi:hypothetical protein